MKEKRKESRIKEENKVTFKVISEDKRLHGKKIFYALTKDISVGGARILTDTLLPIGTVLKIELSLAKRKLISVVGQVKWMNKLYGDELFEMGLEFVNTSPEDIMALIEYIFEQQKE